MPILAATFIAGVFAMPTPGPALQHWNHPTESHTTLLASVEGVSMDDPTPATGTLVAIGLMALAARRSRRVSAAT